VNRKFHFVSVVLRLYRKQFLLNHRLFFEEGIYHEDNLFTPIACYYAQKVKVIPECLYAYRIREGSIMQSNNAKRLMDKIIVANKLSEFFIPIENIDKRQLYREIAGEYFSVFMPKNATDITVAYKVLIQEINWMNYHKVSIYHRHRRIYTLLRLHPILFRMYLSIETILKPNLS
jgi:hypothetical protein